MTKFAPIPRPVPVAPPVPAHVAITLSLDQGSTDLLVRHVRLLRDCVGLAQQRWGFTIVAAVVLPSQMQLLCVFDDAQFGVRGAVALIQSAFRLHVPDGMDVVWSDGCEVEEVEPATAGMRKTMIEDAPVRAGLVACAADWPYSSAHTNVAQSGDMGAEVA